MKKEYALKISSLLIISIVVLSSCYRDNNHPGYVYLPDMDESRAYDTYSENSNYADGKTMQAPVEGTIARGEIPYPYKKDDADLLEAGKTIHNPLNYSHENLERGELLYERFCMNCHGLNGDGKGYLFTSNKFPFPPGDLTAEKAINRPDGEIYHIMTVGFGIMGAHGPQINQEDRWKIVMYIRNDLQQVSESN